MRLLIAAVGRPSGYLGQGVKEYAARLSRYHQVALRSVRDATPLREGQALLELSAGFYRVALPPGGTERSTEELARWSEWLPSRGVSRLAILVGGPSGLSSELLAGCQEQWSLSRLTFPHELALLIALEALYRASSFARGEPYHRAGPA